MAIPNVGWSKKDIVNKPNDPNKIKKAEVAVELAANHPDFSEYVKINIHDVAHKSRDQKNHITVHLQSQQQIDESEQNQIVESVYDVAHIYVDGDGKYNGKVLVLPERGNRNKEKRNKEKRKQKEEQIADGDAH
jgi:hypothetical protein